MSSVDQQPKVIVVTSSVPGEGKTTASLCLARLAARAGMKAIVVDGDFRRPSVAKAANLTDDIKNGVLEALLHSSPLDQCIHKDTLSEASILPCLATPKNPMDIAGSKRLRDLVDQLRETYDIIIIDSAPLLPVNDTKVLSAMADAVLLVIRWEKTPREAASSAAKVLADVRAPVVGVALTRADGERFRYYSYGYQNYGMYSKYYSD